MNIEPQSNPREFPEPKFTPAPPVEPTRSTQAKPAPGAKGQAPKLQSNVIGLLGAATLGVVMLSPAMTLYGGFGPAFLNARGAAPLAFIWALLATIPTAISYALLSSEYPESGSAASWASRAFARRVGIWAGYMVFLYYFTNFVIQPVTLGVFFNDLMALVHVPTGTTTYAVGVLLCCLWPGWIAYRGISLSAKGALGFLLFESAVVLALCVTVLILAPSRTGVSFSTEGFHLAASPDGTSGIFRAMVFAMLAYCGFDVVSTLAEETKMAKKLIPQATLLSLMIYGFFIIGGIWCLTYGGDPAHLKEVAEKGQMPITEVARQFWGSGSVLVTFTAISASLGLAIATAVGASRVLFSMGRQGLAPSRFANLHARYQVPWSAMHVIFAGGLIAALLTGLLIGPYSSYVWWGTTSTFFAMVTYLLVNLSCLVLNRKRVFSSAKNFALFGLIPLFGLAADSFILVRSFFIELWGQGWATGQSVIAFDLVCAALALGAAWKATAPSPSLPEVDLQPPATEANLA